MELRKNPKIDLDRKRGVFFNIGLLISLALVTTAFEWKFYSDGIVVIPEALDSEFEELIEIPPTVIPPPPPPVVEPVFVEVPDKEEVEEIKIIIDAEMLDDEAIPELIFDEEIPDEPVDEIITIAEKMPEPAGGLGSFYKYVGESMDYPKAARRMGIEGRVFVQFVVDKDGSLTEVKTIKGIGGGCDEEAERVLRNAPPWTPGKQRGKPVKVRMVLPITFRLN